jgi:ABC-type multidrug transport system fused ATPase/permease subunit
MIMNPEGVVAVFHRLADKWHANWLRRHANLVVAASDSFTDNFSPSISASGLMPDFVLSSTRDGPLLRLEHISVNFGRIQAVDDVTFSIEPGTIVGLIGPNGAGKTTLLDAISGFSPTSGSVLFEGVPLDGLNPHERARSGISRTFQGGTSMRT